MILVDSSVWIDYFRGASTPQTDLLDHALGKDEILVGDLVLAEVLQGFSRDEEFRQARRLMLSFDVVQLSGRDIALRAAENYRVLRRLGATVRKTIDAIIATHCIESGYLLLHDDHDFDPFVEHLGLRVATDSRKSPQ